MDTIMNIEVIRKDLSSNHKMSRKAHNTIMDLLNDYESGEVSLFDMYKKCDRILVELFGEGDISIPISFMERPVGTFLMGIKLGFDGNNKLFTISDVAVIAGVVKQHISKLMKDAKIDGMRIGRLMVYRESDVIRFIQGRMSYKMFSDREIKARIEAFWFLRRQKKSNEEIEAIFLDLGGKRTIRSARKGELDGVIEALEKLAGIS